jgi:adenosylmethionine-8-amino-7-oxononanoate aminotransferase
MSRNTISTEALPSSVLHASLSIEPPKIVRADGHYLHTSTGNSIFDASGGAAVSSIGHNNTRVKQAILDQLNAVEYTFSPHFTTDAYEKLAKHLVDSTGGKMSKVFVTGSGSEAVEACLKMARQYYTELPEPQPRRTRFIARDRSYHGNTLGSLGVSGHKARRAIYEPMLSQNTSFVSPCYPYRDMHPGETNEAYVARLAQELEDEFQRVGPDTVCAVLFETMAGLTLGAVAPVPGYLKAMQSVCERHGALFVLDEVLAGMGRTGTLHAWEQEDVVPDLQTVAKGLGAGYAPIGALLVSKKVVKVLKGGSKAFMHFQTYHGHPLTCAAALEVQRVIRDEGLVKNCRDMGMYLGERLTRRLGAHRNVGDIRGRGLVWAVSSCSLHFDLLW